jgi:hypothetical protein
MHLGLPPVYPFTVHPDKAVFIVHRHRFSPKPETKTLVYYKL